MDHVGAAPWYRSLRLKLVALAILVEMVMLGLLLANSLRLLNDALESQTNARLEALAPLFNASLSGRVFQRDHAEIESVLGELVRSPYAEIRYITVYDTHGELLAVAGSVDSKRLPSPDVNVGAAIADGVYDASVPLTLLGNPVGSVRFGLSLAAMLRTRDSLMHQGMLIAAAEILLSLLLLLASGYLITRHISPLMAATRRIASGDYRFRVPVIRHDEIGQLADNFNAMSSAIEDRIQALSDSEARFREIFDTVNDAIFILHLQTGRILDVNRRMCELYGCARDEVLSKAPNIFGDNEPPYTDEMAMDYVRRAVTEGPQLFDWHARTRDGQGFWVEVNLRRARIGHEDRLLAVVRDISERKQHQQELEYLAHHDVLTHLPNRLLLADRLKQAIAHGRRANWLFAVAYLDLDDFKPVNDTFGHDAGDQLLIEVARRLRASVRDGDTISRFGGDEFVLLMLNFTNIAECTKAFDRILVNISKPYTVAGVDVVITASIGVTLYPLDETDPDTLIRHADQAMHAAKLGGRKRFHLFDPEQDQLAKEYREVRARIAEALLNKEFVLYYQPMVNLSAGTVVGAEALIRWQHPERGLIPPAQFLPLIDESDLAVELGNWVLEQAITQVAAWHGQGFSLCVSVNIAARHIHAADFVERLAGLLAAQSQLPADSLELEILETAALSDIDWVGGVIDACHRLGVKFALDDFGTGYSSLSYFKQLRLDTLKIDQSFVRDMLDDKEDRAIVEGVIGLTRAFQRQVVAEGVETAAHGRALLELGCSIVQGYGIARPMPAEELPAWISAYHRKS